MAKNSFQRLRDLQAASVAKIPVKTGTDEIAFELAKLQEDLRTISSNMARAKTDEQYQAVSTQFDQLKDREGVLQIKLAEAKVQTNSNAEIDVKAVIGALQKLLALSNENKLKLASEALRQADAKLFLAFSELAVKKRTLN